ncbi:MAG: hypothetical protein EBS05_06380 [Proteobacteria bacterium]|jgi:uncharacterized membrane protein|nr:hypothetical protein [Pseudomonadota bacterium]
MKADDFLNALNHDAIVAAIKSAEAKTSGEIRVFVSRKLRPDALAAAQSRFEKLGMTRTRERNGVLIYVAPRSRTFAIIGDEGVHTKCGVGFWADVAKAMTDEFRKGDFTAGIVLGVHQAGILLAKHFPRQGGDQNELPDEVLTD